MKKSLILGILGLAVGAVSSYGQGVVFLDNYLVSAGAIVSYGASLGGGPLPSGFTAGIYYDPTANANITGSVAADPTGTADPSTLNAALVAATGSGSTAPFIGSGYFYAGASFLVQPGAATPAQSSYTFMIVAYNGATYDTSTIRGHSTAFYLQDAAPDVVFGGDLGQAFSAFAVSSVVPEPTTIALGGLGLAALLIARRKKA